MYVNYLYFLELIALIALWMSYALVLAPLVLVPSTFPPSLRGDVTK